MPRATWCWALARHRTSFSQPGHSRQRAAGPRCGRRSRSRSYKLGIFTTAPPAQSPMHLRPGMWSPVSLRGDSRPSRGSAALTFPTSGFSTERVGGPHAWSQMHGRLRRRCRAEEDRSPVFVPRAASAERYDSTCYRVTRCETGHSCCRAAHWRTACVPCVRVVRLRGAAVRRGAGERAESAEREWGEPSFKG